MTIISAGTAQPIVVGLAAVGATIVTKVVDVFLTRRARKDSVIMEERRQISADAASMRTELREQIDDATDRIDKLEKRNEELYLINQNLRSDNIRLQSEIIVLRRKMADMDSEITTLKRINEER